MRARSRDARAMIGRVSFELVNGDSLETLQKITQHAIPLIPVGSAGEMALVAVDLEVGGIDARRLQLRHHRGSDARRKQLVGARQDVEQLGPNLREVLLGVVMRARLRQR